MQLHKLSPTKRAKLILGNTSKSLGKSNNGNWMIFQNTQEEKTSIWINKKIDALSATPEQQDKTY